MYSERRVRDQIRDVFQDQVDRFERKTGEGLDRLAAKGGQELGQLREDLRDELGSRGRRGRRTTTSHSAGRGRRHRRSSKKRRRSSADRAQARLLRRARRRAHRRLAFVTHFGTFVGTLGIIAIATRSIRVVAIVALSWGIGVFMHYLWAIWAPTWRDRSVEEEVGSRSPRAVAHERQQVETRSRRSMEDLSASIAHEIRNPITAAKSLVQRMGEDPPSEDNLEYAEQALAELDRVERSVSHLLRYARDEEPRFAPLMLRSVAASAVAVQRDRAQRAGVDLTLEFEVDAPVKGDPEKLRRVIGNLISNAIDAFERADPASRFDEDPKIEVSGGENRAGNEVWVRVVDNGPGVPASEQERIWSPFFTTKETGTGLGLALSRKTIEAHGGRIELLTDRARGSEFLVSFPKDQEIHRSGGRDDG